MFSNLFRRVVTITSKPSGFLFIGGLFLTAFLVWQYQTGLRVGDGAIKQQQVADLVHNGFPDFTCRYSGATIDPEYRFLPLDMKRGATMTHVYQGKCYYVFPFYYTALQYPLVLLMGRFGSFFLSIVFGILTLISSYLIARRLGLKPETQFIFLTFLLLGSAFSVFATDLSETIISIFGVTLGIYYLIRREEAPSIADLATAGILFGFAALFRQEVILLAASIGLVHLFYSIQKPRYLIFSLSFGILVLAQAYINQAVVGHPLGSRGHLQNSITESFDLVQQLDYLKQLLFYGKGSLGLFGAYPILLFFIRWKRETVSMNQIFFAILVFIFVSALLTSPKFWQGVMFGPRFLMTILPVSFLFCFSILEKHWSTDSKLLKAIMILFIGYSIVGALSFDRLYHKFTHSIVMEQAELNRFTEKTIIYRQGSVFLPSNSFDIERNVFELDQPENFDILLGKLETIGIQKITVVGFKDSYRQDVLVPESKRFELKNRIFHQSQSIHMETLEFTKK